MLLCPPLNKGEAAATAARSTRSLLLNVVIKDVISCAAFYPKCKERYEYFYYYVLLIVRVHSQTMIENNDDEDDNDDFILWWWTVSSYLAFFLLLIARNVVPHSGEMFHWKPNGNERRRFAMNHRIAGAMHLLVLVFGGVYLMLLSSYNTSSSFTSSMSRRRLRLSVVAFDLVLGLSGILVTRTAVKDFGRLHSRVRERRTKSSGVLHETKTVATSEMEEHFFYQMVNLTQVLYLHFCEMCDGKNARTLALVLSTWSIWRYRDRFPVNSFSRNYEGGENGRWFESVENFLYRAKKWQYVFYKTCNKHGLNVSSAIFESSSSSSSKTTTTTILTTHGERFQLYWLCLNASYVMEFFLQTLVKKKYGTQSNALLMNQFLMVVSSLSAFPVVVHRVHPIAFVAALALNFLNRKQETANVCLTCVACVVFERFVKI